MMYAGHLDTDFDTGFPVPGASLWVENSLTPLLEGVGADALVLCVDGQRPARDLFSGCHLLTLNGASIEIVGLRLFRATASSEAIFVEIPEGVLGAKRATLVAHNQCLFMKHFLASAFFGQNEVIAPARWLVHRGPLRKSDRMEAEFCQIECKAQELVNVNGMWMGTSSVNRESARLMLDEAQCDLATKANALFREPRGSK